MDRRGRGYAIGTSVLTLLFACTAPLPRPPYVRQPTTALVETPFPPPPARAEFVPNKPAKGAVWIDGEWTWRGHRWGWNAGRWVIPPPGAAFSPWTTVRGADGTLFFAQGTWRNAQGEVVAAPVPLALGTSGATASPAAGQPAVAEAPAAEDTEADGGS